MPYKKKDARNAYMRKYRKIHAKLISKQRHILKRQKNTNKYRDLQGHVDMVYGSVSRWAKGKGIPICTASDFKEWSLDTKSGYPILHDRWAEGGFTDDSPMITRKDSKKPYSIDNLRWTTKQSTGITSDQKARKKLRRALQAEINDQTDQQTTHPQDIEKPEAWIQQEIARRKECNTGEGESI